MEYQKKISAIEEIHTTVSNVALLALREYFDSLLQEKMDTLSYADDMTEVYRMQGEIRCIRHIISQLRLGG